VIRTCEHYNSHGNRQISRHRGHPESQTKKDEKGGTRMSRRRLSTRRITTNELERVKITSEGDKKEDDRDRMNETIN
jgi:hypothetical protein